MNPGYGSRSLRIRTSSQTTRAATRAAFLLLTTVGIACSSDGGGTGTGGNGGPTGSGGSATTGGTGGSSNGTGAGGSGTGNGAGGSTTGTGGATTGGTTTGTGGATTGGTTTGGTTTGGTTTGGTTTGTTGTTGTGGATGGTTTGTGGAGGTGTGGAGGTGTGGTGTGGAGGGPSVDAGPPAIGCNLNTGYAGDDQCILPPPPDKGFQVHIGPKDYKNPEALYLLQPGQEVTTENMMGGNSPNTTKAYFFYRQFRMRPTAHHVILSAPNGFDVGRRIGTANKSEDYPAGGIIAPEDKNVGIPIEPNTPVSVSFHAINTTTKPQLREMWVNFWYRDPAEVTQPAEPWFETGSVTFAIPPHTKQVLGPYTCTVSGNGRMLWTYGHRHANNTRFQMWRVRGAKRDMIYDGYDWEHPLLLEFNTVVKNKPVDPANRVEGGWNGILDLLTGDKIEWTCDVNNTTDGTLRFTNNTFTGEMCIVDAEAVGSTCQ
jgi:hypothetical protein